MATLTDNYVFTVSILRLLMHRPMMTTELYAHARAICSTHCKDDIHDNWEIAWKHRLRNAQQHLRRIGAIKKKPKGFWSLAR